MKRIEEEKNLNGKRILLRLDLNVPLNNGKIIDTSKLRLITTVFFWI